MHKKGTVTKREAQSKREHLEDIKKEAKEGAKEEGAKRAS